MLRAMGRVSSATEYLGKTFEGLDIGRIQLEQTLGYTGGRVVPWMVRVLCRGLVHSPWRLGGGLTDAQWEEDELQDQWCGFNVTQ